MATNTLTAKIPAQISLRVGSEVMSVGNESQFYALMSTISVNFEPRGWGTKYPMLMRRLYPGQLMAADVRAALEELADIESKMSKLKPDKLVWDITTPLTRPDEKQVWLGAPSLVDAFRTTDGERALEVIKRALITAMKKTSDIFVELGRRAA